MNPGDAVQFQTKSGLLIVFFAVLVSPCTNAHHSATAFYDMTRAGEIEGVITGVRWTNPHVIIKVQSTSEDAASVSWKIEGAAINTLQRQGITADSVALGERVTVAGAVSRRGRNEMFGAILSYEDGRTVVLADGIAVQLGLMERLLTATESSESQAPGANQPRVEQGIFTVWSRNVGDSYPRPTETLKYTDAALAAQAAWDPLVDDTGLSCIPQGMPGVIANPYPIQFIDEGERITLLIEEWDTVRTIHMNADEVADAPASALGYSTGEWEGNTLVVRTTRISWPYYDDVGTPQSEDMEVIEHFTLSDDGERLDYVQTAFDPLTFNVPAVIRGYFWRMPGDEIKPFNCDYSN